MAGTTQVGEVRCSQCTQSGATASRLLLCTQPQMTELPLVAVRAQITHTHTGDLGWRAPSGVPGSAMAGHIVLTGECWMLMLAPLPSPCVSP
jgi:hypothetical protein